MIDRNSPSWLSITSATRKRILELQEELEVEGREPEGLRGEIRALRWVLALGEQDDTVMAPAIDYNQVRTPQDPS